MSTATIVTPAPLDAKVFRHPLKWTRNHLQKIFYVLLFAHIGEFIIAALYYLIGLQTSNSSTTPRRRSASPSAWRTDQWNDADEDLRTLREQSFLDASGSHFSASQDVRYSLGLND